jgi:hypothetical protein
MPAPEISHCVRDDGDVRGDGDVRDDSGIGHRTLNCHPNRALLTVIPTEHS